MSFGVCRVGTVGRKSEKKIQIKEESGNLVFGHGSLERLEKSGKINGYRNV